MDTLISTARKEDDTSACENHDNSASNDHRILNIIKECINDNLLFIDKNFELPTKLVNGEPNESDEECDLIEEALSKVLQNNKFNCNPLPAIVGSKDFYIESFSKLTGEPTSPSFTLSSDTQAAETVSEEIQSQPSSDEAGSDDEDLFKEELTGIASQKLISSHDPLTNSHDILSNSDIGSINRETFDSDKTTRSLAHQSSDSDDDLFKPPDNNNTKMNFTKLLPNNFASQLENTLAIARPSSIQKANTSKNIFASDDEEDDLFLVIKKDDTSKKSETTNKSATPKLNISNESTNTPLMVNSIKSKEPPTNSIKIEKQNSIDSTSKSSGPRVFSSSDSDDDLFKPLVDNKKALSKLAPKTNIAQQPSVKPALARKPVPLERKNSAKTANASDDDDLFKPSQNNTAKPSQSIAKDASLKPEKSVESKKYETLKEIEQTKPSFLSDDEDEEDDLFVTINKETPQVNNRRVSESSIVSKILTDELKDKLAIRNSRKLSDSSSDTNQAPTRIDADKNENRSNQSNILTSDSDDDDLFKPSKSLTVNSAKMASTISTQKEENLSEPKKPPIAAVRSSLVNSIFETDDDEEDLFVPIKKDEPKQASQKIADPLLLTRVLTSELENKLGIKRHKSPKSSEKESEQENSLSSDDDDLFFSLKK